MMDGTQINVDVTAPGAIIALALIFLKVCFLSHLESLYTFSFFVQATPDFCIIMADITGRV